MWFFRGPTFAALLTKNTFEIGNCSASCVPFVPHKEPEPEWQATVSEDSGPAARPPSMEDAACHLSLFSYLTGSSLKRADLWI